MKFICLILSAFSISMASAGAATIYVAQSSTGSSDGSSCSNARSATWFNTSSNWGTGSGQVSPGSTVYLCGTITTNLSFQGSGASGNVITVDGSSATMAASFIVSNRSYWRVQNAKWADGFNRQLIAIAGGSNGVFTNNSADNVSGDPAIWLAQGSSLPSDITISRNSIRTTAADLGNTQLDIIKTEGSRRIIIEQNYLEMRAGGAGNYSHDDVIQTYESGSSSSQGNPQDWTVRYNQIVMNSAATNDRSWMMLENLSGVINIYGNVFLGLRGADGANGIASNSNDTSVVFNIFNNTFVTKGSSTNNLFNLATPGRANIRNNIVHTVNQTVFAGNMSISRDHNLWYGSNSPSCSSSAGDICGRAAPFKDYTNNDFTLVSALPGLALTTEYSFDRLGQKRGLDGAWDLGAYEYNAGATEPVPAPTATPAPAPAPTPVPTSPTPAPPVTGTESLLGTKTPSSVNNNDGTNYELGMKFYATTAGVIRSIRFYKSPSESGTHTGKIYSATGSLLASVVFANESSSGWQEQALPTPLSIAANANYVVSVNTGAGYYVTTVGDFATQKASTNLRAVVGANGVFGSVGAMPTQSWNSSNYFRDVVFLPSSTTAVDTAAPKTAITSPAAASQVATRSIVSIQATSSDNVAVKKVEFYVNGVLRCTDTAAPYSCSWTVPSQIGSTYRLRTRAYDAAGNVGYSTIVSVTSK